MDEKQMKVLGWVATFMSVMMYVSYFPQIMNNLAGQKGNFIQPLGLLRLVQKRKRYSACCCQCTRYYFWPGNGYHSFDLTGTEETGCQSVF